LIFVDRETSSSLASSSSCSKQASKGFKVWNKKLQTAKSLLALGKQDCAVPSEVAHDDLAAALRAAFDA
jgi:hypothetical protein